MNHFVVASLHQSIATHNIQTLRPTITHVLPAAQVQHPFLYLKLFPVISDAVGAMVTIGTST